MNKRRHVAHAYMIAVSAIAGITIIATCVAAVIMVDDIFDKSPAAVIEQVWCGVPARPSCLFKFNNGE